MSNYAHTPFLIGHGTEKIVASSTFDSTAVHVVICISPQQGLTLFHTGSRNYLSLKWLVKMIVMGNLRFLFSIIYEPTHEKRDLGIVWFEILQSACTITQSG